MLVFGRDAETLRGIYASGASGFLHDMLDAAGGTNVFADVYWVTGRVIPEVVETHHTFHTPSRNAANMILSPSGDHP